MEKLIKNGKWKMEKQTDCKGISKEMPVKGEPDDGKSPVKKTAAERRGRAARD